jgi:TRAP-type mannitol/chloroaromatic compound transport system permease small subunit
MTAEQGQPTEPQGLADRIAVGAGRAFAWLFAVAIVLSAYEVLMRYAFAAPSTLVHATTTTLCQIGFALGGAWCMVKGEHIRITFLPDKISGRRRWLVELIALATGAFYLAGLLYAVYLDARAAIWKFGFDGAWAPELTPGPPNWPLPSIGKAALVIGTALFLAVVVQHLIRHLTPKRA